MNENILAVNEPKVSLIAKAKNEIEKRKILEIFPHNLSMLRTGLSTMVIEKDENGNVIYRTKQRLKMIELENLEIQIECEEYSYFLSACAFLNDFEIEYELEDSIKHLTKEYAEIKVDDIDELIEILEDSIERNISEELFLS